jgi:hypothetical protein
MRKFRLCLRVVAVVLTAIAPLPLSAEHPDIPPGQDPGGTAVSIVSAALDFKQPGLQPRLARDGEGVAIAWDFSSSDANAATAEATAMGVASHLIQDLAARSDLRLVPVRIDPHDPATLAKALGFVSRTPAQLVLLDLADHTPLQEKILTSAGEQFSDLIIIVGSKSETALKVSPSNEPKVAGASAPAARLVGTSKSKTAETSNSDVVYNGASETEPPLNALAQTLSMIVRTLVACGPQGWMTSAEKTLPVRDRALTILGGGDAAGHNVSKPIELKPCAAAYQ